MTGLELSAKKNTTGMIFTVLLYAVGAASVPHAKIAELISSSDEVRYYVGAISRAICSLLPVYLIFQFNFGGIFRADKRFFKGLIFTLPAFMVAIDNFPFVPIVGGDMTLKIYAGNLFPYLLYCISIGVMEELIFRGNILPLFMYKYGGGKTGAFKAVVYSSAVFGAMHLLNLFNGFGVGVFLQVGYSFLIGCVCALTTLFTGNIFSAIAVHSLFDVGGFLFEEFGAGTLWTTSNIVVTAIVSVVCAAALIVGFFKVDSDWVYENCV